MNEQLNKWLVQANKGFLELCILEAIRGSEDGMYGVQIAEALNTAGVEIKEGSLYPLLNRMDQNGWLQSTWHTPDGSGGHPKRVYSLATDGMKLLPLIRDRFEVGYLSLQQLKNS